MLSPDAVYHLVLLATGDEMKANDAKVETHQWQRRLRFEYGLDEIGAS